MAEDEDAIRRLFAKVRSYEWDEVKRARNWRVHGIDFADVKGTFDGPTFIRRSDRYGEIRYQVLGTIEGHEIAVACAVEGETCRFISARRARRDERKIYHAAIARRRAEGQD